MSWMYPQWLNIHYVHFSLKSSILPLNQMCAIISKKNKKNPFRNSRRHPRLMQFIKQLSNSFAEIQSKEPIINQVMLRRTYRLCGPSWPAGSAPRPGERRRLAPLLSQANRALGINHQNHTPQLKYIKDN